MTGGMRMAMVVVEVVFVRHLQVNVRVVVVAHDGVVVVVTAAARFALVGRR